MCNCVDKTCQYKESELYWHEALDRSHVARNHFYEYVLQHPAITHSERLSEKATKALVAMGDLYQAIGSEAHRFNTRGEK